MVSSGSTESQHLQVGIGLAGFDQPSHASGVVAAIISSLQGVRASIDVERYGIELRALGKGAGASTTLVRSKVNLIDSVSLLLLLIDLCEVWPSTSTVAADEAQLTRRPL